MARFEPKGVDGMSLDLQKLGQISDQDAYTILTPAADLLGKKFKAKIAAIFRQRTGKLAAAIKGFRKKGGEGPFMLVYPYGAHHTYNSRKGGTKTATAAEVGFVLEYGDGSHKATHWMENTVAENEIEITEAMQEGFDTLCDQRGIGG